MSKSQLWNIILAGALAITIYMLLRQRFGSGPVPEIKTISSQQTIIKHDSIASQHFKDSVQQIVNQANAETIRWKNEWDQLATKYNGLENGMNDLLTQDVPDTCKSIQQRLLLQFNKLVATNRQKDQACAGTIASQQTTIDQKDQLITQGKTDYKKLRENLDTAFDQQKKLEAYVKQIRPRSTIYAGVLITGDKTKYLSGIGANLGLQNKKGTMYEAGIIRSATTTSYTIAVKKPLFKF